MRLAGALGIGLAALVVAPAGCSLDFPKVSSPHTFRCRGNADCAQGYLCGAGGYCVSRNAVGPPDGGAGDGGITDGGSGDGGVTDGGIGDGGASDGGSSDGGVSDGGVGPGGCLAAIAVWPSTVDTDFATPATVYLPPSFGFGTLSLAGAGQAPTLSVTSNPGEYTMTVPKGLSAGDHVLKVPSASSGGPCYSTTVHVVSELGSGSGGITAKPADVSSLVPTRIQLSITGVTLAPSTSPVPVWVYAVAPSGTGTTVIPLADPYIAGQTEVDATAPISKGTGGSFDLVVVTPTVAVRGSAAIAFIDGIQPPKITSVSPVHVEVGAATKVTVAGTGLDQGATLALSCVGPTGGYVAGGYQSVTVDGNGNLQADLTPDARVVAGAPCKLEYRGSGVPYLSTEFAGLSAYDPSASPSAPAWTYAGQLIEPRTGAGAAIARLTDGQRYLVVAGGVDHSGSTTTPASQDEIFPLQPDGTFTKEIQHQPGLLSASGIEFPTVIAAGHIIYAIGGNALTASPPSAVYEAEILDPADRPKKLQARLVVGNGVTGPGSGALYYYTVTAVFAPSPSNPMDEGPAAFTIQVPMPENDPAKVVLTWNQVSGATGYNVYRGTVPAAYDLERVNQTPVTKLVFDDTGPGSGTGIAPHEPGNLTAWYPVMSPTFPSPRTEAGGVSVPVGSSPGDRDLVIGGGQNGGDLDSAVVGSLLPATQGRGFTLSSFTATTKVLSTARSQVEARVVGPDWSPSTVTVPWVLFGPGDATAGAPVDAWTAAAPALVTASGTTAGSADPGAAFFVGATSALLDGTTSTGQQVILVAPLTVDTGSTPPPPKVGTWQDVSTTSGAGLPTPVGGMATAEDDGYCYVVGGTNRSSGSGAGDSIGDIELTIR